MVGDRSCFLPKPILKCGGGSLHMECAADAALSNLRTTSCRGSGPFGKLSAGPVLDSVRLRGRSRFGAAKARDPRQNGNAAAPLYPTVWVVNSPVQLRSLT